MSRQQKSLTLKQNKLGPVADQILLVPTGSWRTFKPQLQQALCVRCGICAEYCPTAVICVQKDAAEALIFDWAFCKGCGICANICPKHALEMVRERVEE